MGLFELPVEVAGKDLELMKRRERNLVVKRRCCIPIHNNVMTENYCVHRLENYHDTFVS